MKKLIIISFTLLTFLSCKKDNELVEVQIPDPETLVTQTTFGNPADVKVDEGGNFKMKGLKYSYDALAPFIDGKTMLGLKLEMILMQFKEYMINMFLP